MVATLHAIPLTTSSKEEEKNSTTPNTTPSTRNTIKEKNVVETYFVCRAFHAEICGECHNKTKHVKLVCHLLIIWLGFFPLKPEEKKQHAQNNNNNSNYKYKYMWMEMKGKAYLSHGLPENLKNNMQIWLICWVNTHTEREREKQQQRPLNIE